MNLTLSALVVSAASLLAGCVNTVTLTRSGAPEPAKPANCDFQVLTAAPAGDFVEVGTLDIAAMTGQTNKLSSFKTLIAPRVCEAGGEAVIALANGAGHYIKATVIKASAHASTPAAPTLTQASVAAPDAKGCTFDTQCKGERVCAKGECVEPKSKTTEPKSKTRP